MCSFQAKLDAASKDTQAKAAALQEREALDKNLKEALFKARAFIRCCKFCSSVRWCGLSKLFLRILWNINYRSLSSLQIQEQAKAKTEELARKRADHEKAQADLRPLQVRMRLFPRSDSMLLSKMSCLAASVSCKVIIVLEGVIPLAAETGFLDAAH